MEPIDVSQILIVVLILVWIVSARSLDSRWRDLGEHLRRELRGRVPVYSAETTRAKEAEFIRDRLPKKIPIAIILLAVVAFGAVAWWVTR